MKAKNRFLSQNSSFESKLKFFHTVARKKVFQRNSKRVFFQTKMSPNILTLTTSKWPLLEATIKGDHPMLDCLFTAN